MVIIDMMLFNVLSAIIGLICGSFVNAWSDRLLTGEPMLNGRSHCDTCSHVLSPIDLIPLFSWLSLKGRCRYCDSPIPYQNPLVEISMMVLFLHAGERIMQVYIGVESIIILLATAALLVCLVTLFVVDYREYLLPDKVLLCMAVVAVTLHTSFWSVTGMLHGGLSATNILFSAVGVALPYLFIILVTKGKGMGAGDMKLSFVMGLLLGFPNILVAQYVAFLLGGVLAASVLVLGKKQFGQMIPFGPFLVIGTYVAWIWGDQLWTMFGFI